MGILDGKVAIITGAARGQGAAEARLLTSNGAKVVITDVLTELGQQVADEIGEHARFVAHDVSSPEGWGEAVQTAVDTFGSVDVLVNNAAISRPFKLEDTDPELFETMFRVNQLGVYLGMRAVIPPMKQAGGGSIINISSVAGLRGTSTIFAYGSTKWAVRGMTKSAALELARYRIRVNCICPGLIDTPILDTNPASMNEAIMKTVPMRRMGQPEEIADAVLFLASSQSSFVTGADLAVDGGMSL
jgi:3alpha(or 20beta)-hydroxysteroid dehydrogenase